MRDMPATKENCYAAMTHLQKLGGPAFSIRFLENFLESVEAVLPSEDIKPADIDPPTPAA